MTIRPDNRLLDVPLVRVGCGRCGATVRVRKSTWAQTSVQWDAAALDACIQRRQALALADHGRGAFLVCSELRDSIEDAARRGELPIVDDNYAGNGPTR